MGTNVFLKAGLRNSDSKRFFKILWVVILALYPWLLSAQTFAKAKKAVYVIVDGIPADQIERLHTPAIFDIASKGAYSRAYTGGEIGGYSQTGPPEKFPSGDNLSYWLYQSADSNLV